MLADVVSAILEANADALERVELRAYQMIKESVPTQAVELLAEYESELGFAPTGTTDERLARVVSRTLARQRYRPVDFQTALAALFRLPPSSVVVIERTAAQAAAMGDVREIFRFFVFRDPALPGAWFIASAQELIDAIKPSHTAGYAIESDDFLTDDPYSLTDRDVLGA